MSERDDIYREYHDTVNMTYRELELWSHDPCSELASLDRSPVDRNLRLLSKSRTEWTLNDIEDAKRTISFIRRMSAVKAGRSVGSGCPSKRDISLRNWAFDPDKLMKSNPRVRMYDAESIAKNIRETFTAKPSKKRTPFDFQWPAKMHHVGDSLAVSYASDKWKDDGDFDVYKHIAESRNVAFCVPGFLRDFDDPAQPWQTIGPMVDFTNVPMPEHFAVLGYFEEADLALHTEGSNARPGFSSDENEGVVKVTVRHGMLGASKILWSQTDSSREDEPFLFVYTNTHGVLMIIIGDELDVEADGIVG